MRVTTSWIFNRLCDEPERLKEELIEYANAAEHMDLKRIAEITLRFTELQRVEKDVAELRLTSPAVLSIVIDHPYIKVTTSEGR